MFGSKNNVIKDLFVGAHDLLCESEDKSFKLNFGVMFNPFRVIVDAFISLSLRVVPGVSVV
jgi:hypothetical protein